MTLEELKDRAFREAWMAAKEMCEPDLFYGANAQKVSARLAAANAAWTEIMERIKGVPPPKTGD